MVELIKGWSQWSFGQLFGFQANTDDIKINVSGPSKTNSTLSVQTSATASKTATVTVTNTANVIRINPEGSSNPTNNLSGPW